MWKKLLIGLGVLIVILVIVIATRPDEFRVTRSAEFAAPPEAVFAKVNDLRAWEAWSPWAKIDPAMKQTYDGPSAGVGAVSSWAGNHEVGEGKMTITESKPPERIVMRLDFYKPMAGTSTTEFTFAGQGSRTVMTWTMSGKNNFIAKAMCMVMDMDTMVGGQFEKGLATLKTLVETKQP